MTRVDAAVDLMLMEVGVFFDYLAGVFYFFLFSEPKEYPLIDIPAPDAPSPSAPLQRIRARRANLLASGENAGDLAAFIDATYAFFVLCIGFTISQAVFLPEFLLPLRVSLWVLAVFKPTEPFLSGSLARGRALKHPRPERSCLPR